MKFRIAVQWLLWLGWRHHRPIQEPAGEDHLFSAVSKWLAHPSNSLGSPMCDGYAAVIYSRRKTIKGFDVQLVAARGRGITRLSQSAQECTIPKLKLEDVVLLVELRNCLGGISTKFTACTYSKVTLSCSQKNKNKHVRKRVTGIRKYLSSRDIHHIKSKHSPGECASRVVYPLKLVEHDL